DVEDACLRAGDQAGDGHAFDDQMRQVADDETVLDGAGFAFVGVADDKFHGVRLFADEVPLHGGGKSGAAHTAEFGFFQGSEDAVVVSVADQLAQHNVFFPVPVGIGS